MVYPAGGVAETREMARGFDGRTVWITGASGGLGEALAHAFGAEGARLVLSARRAGELDRVAAAVAEAGGTARALPMDLADPDSIAHAAADVARVEGRIDVLVHNAGLTQRALVADAGIEIYRRLFEVNFFGPLALTRAALPAMAGGGRIVAISSIAAYYSSPYRSGYNASKKALHGLFDAFRAEAHRDGISVLLVVLGSVRTQVSVNALRGDGSTLRPDGPRDGGRHGPRRRRTEDRGGDGERARGDNRRAAPPALADVAQGVVPARGLARGAAAPAGLTRPLPAARDSRASWRSENALTEPLWTPSPDRVRDANLTRYRAMLEGRGTGSRFPDYAALHRWSVGEKAAFWISVWDFCGVIAETRGRHRAGRRGPDAGGALVPRRPAQLRREPSCAGATADRR